MRLPLNQIATLWTATSDGFGGFSFGAPTEIKCRWEEKSEQLPGSTELSRAVIYVDQDMSVEDHLLLGASTSTTPSDIGAQRIRAFKKIPDLRSLETLRKVWL